MRLQFQNFMQLIYSRSIDKSLLWDGFSIQSCFLDIVTEITGTLGIGERRNIKFLLNGTIYDGIVLKNLPFNRNNYPNHKEIYQVRYSPTSPISNALRAIYSDVWTYISNEQKIQREAIRNGEPRRTIKVPNDLQRKIAFFTTEIPDVWLVETYNANDNNELIDSLHNSNELDYEQYDLNSRIEHTKKIVKLRVLDKTIGNNLKKLYKYHCQVCGEAVSLKYGVDSVADAHHIDPFTVSQNNNFDNIMILCPNHHRIIHACHGIFQRKIQEIWYPNGLHEKLLLNLHL